MFDVWLLTRSYTAKYEELMRAEELAINIDTHISIWTPMNIRSGFNKLGIQAGVFRITDLPNLPLPKLVIDTCPAWLDVEAKTLLDIEANGTIVINDATSHIKYHDKWNQAEVLMREGVNFSKTVKIDLPLKREKIGILKSQLEDLRIEIGYPLVIKARSTGDAQAVFKCMNEDDALNACMVLYNMKNDYGYVRVPVGTQWPASVIAQKYVDHKISGMGILRVHVVGFKAMAAQQRTPIDETDFFVSNRLENSYRRKFIIPHDLAELCELACQKLNLAMATLDVMHDGEKYIIIELNTNGGFKQLSISNPHLDLGYEIAKYASGYLK